MMLYHMKYMVININRLVKIKNNVEDYKNRFLKVHDIHDY